MNMKIIKINKGFTLVETMFAVMILTFTIVSMMTVVANSLFAARYAKDEITVNYLLQEVIDSIRNDRDTSVFLQNTQTIDAAWDDFADKYTDCVGPRGCTFDVLSSTSPTLCPTSGCPKLCYDSNADTSSFYVNEDTFGDCPGTGQIQTNFSRKIVVTRNADEINVTVTISWLNGTLTRTRSLSTTFMKWQS